MGDGAEIPVEGYGTCELKINGITIPVTNCLCVRTLDSTLFSNTTGHAYNGKGYTFLLFHSNIYSMFPHFYIVQHFPENGDIRVPLQPLKEHDWAIPSFLCDSQEEDDNYFEDVQGRLHLINIFIWMRCYHLSAS